MRAPAFWDARGPASLLLSPLGFLYGRALEKRFRGVVPWKPPIPVICVGNVVVGGAGKTPVALDVARRLIGRGVEAHFLSRGYGGRLKGPVRVDPGSHQASDVGDEPLLLAGRAPTWISRDRVPGAKAAWDAGARAIVMDDGFQNPYIGKDLSLLVVDGGYGVGNGLVMPAGPLREPLDHALARTDAVILLGDDETGLAGRLAARPLLRARTVPGPEGNRLAGRRVVAFAGIGRPEKFFATLRGLGAELVAVRDFADHHPFTAGEIDDIVTQARRLDARAVTTEKDFVRVPRQFHRDVEALTIALRWDDETALDAILAKPFSKGP